MKEKLEQDMPLVVDYKPLKETLIQILQVNLKLTKEKQDKKQQEKEKNKSIFSFCSFFSDSSVPLSSIEIDRKLTRAQLPCLQYFNQNQQHEAVLFYSIWDRIDSMSSLNMPTVSLSRQVTKMDPTYQQIISLFYEINRKITAILDKESTSKSLGFRNLFEYITTKKQYEYLANLKKRFYVDLEKGNLFESSSSHDRFEIYWKVRQFKEYPSCKRKLKELELQKPELLTSDYSEYKNLLDKDLKLAILKDLAPESYAKVIEKVNHLFEEYKENYWPEQSHLIQETVSL